MSRLPVDTDAIRALATILTETGLTEIEVAEKDTRIRVVRAPAQVVQAYAPPATAPSAGAVPAVAPASASGTGETDFAKHPGAVTSPMVGVAYLSPEPNAPAFASEGHAVSVGQTLMLIEAMKTFNQIKAPRAGTLVRLLVTSGSPVEFGEVLAIIE